LPEHSMIENTENLLTRLRVLVARLEPPHGHKVPGRWDYNSSSDICEECADWLEIRSLLGLPQMRGWPESMHDVKKLRKETRGESR